MKICPTCHTRFDGNEAFCPDDGSELVEARELSPGALTGTTIGKSVILERLMWSDDFAERYSGRMSESKTEVHVTVIQPGIEFAADAAAEIEATRAKVGAPLPAELSTLLRTELNHVPAFVIQTAPRGPSLREVLDERECLDWKTAARIVCRVARASDWLLERDVVHWALHPGSLHVVKLDEGDVELGEWFFNSLMGDRAPQQRIKAREPFAGYLGTMAPEVAAGDEPDQRSVVFALGALLFELMTGKPPFAGATPASTLERLQTESAVKVSIARGDGELHPDLDDVVEMMLAREPDRRLQTPMAAVAILANILDSSPEELAPPIERGEDGFDELYSTTEMSSVDREKVEAARAAKGAADTVAEHDPLEKTLPMGSPIDPESADSDEDNESGSLGKTLPMGSPIDPDRDDSDNGSTTTLMMGSGVAPIGAAIDEEAAKAAEDEAWKDALPDDVDSDDEAATSQDDGDEDEDQDDAPSMAISGQSTTSDDSAPGEALAEDIPDTEPVGEEEFNAKKTLMMGSIGPAIDEAVKAEAQEAEAQEAEAQEAEAQEAEAQEAEAQEAEAQEAEAQEAEAQEAEVEPSEEAAEQDDQDEPEVEETPASELETRELGRVDADEDDDEIDPEDTQKLDLATGEVDAAVETETPVDPEAHEKETVEVEREEKSPASELNIGFVEAAQSDAAPDDWFSGTDESLWERSYEEEMAEESEKRWKVRLYGALGALVFAGILLIIYSQFIYEPESPEEEADAVVAVEKPKKPEIDLQRVQQRFESAVDAGRLIAPPGNSAVSALEMLVDNSEDTPETAQAIERFVAAATAAAADAEESGNLRAARLLLAKATTYAPDNSELRSEYEEVDARYRGTIGSLDGSDAGTAATPDVGALEEAAEAEEPVEETSPVATETRAEVAPKPTPKPAPKPEAKPAAKPKANADELIKQARSAYSRGDLSASEKLYREALGVDSRNHTVNAGLGQVYFDQGAYSRAVKHQMQAVRAKPNQVEYRINLGQSYYRLGKYQDAIQSWEAALARDPGNANAKRYIQLARGKLD